MANRMLKLLNDFAGGWERRESTFRDFPNRPDSFVKLQVMESRVRRYYGARSDVIDWLLARIMALSAGWAVSGVKTAFKPC